MGNIKQSLGCLCKELRIRFMKITFLKRQVRQLNSLCPKKKTSVAASPIKPSSLAKQFKEVSALSSRETRGSVCLVPDLNLPLQEKAG